jgi:DNA-binding GntR family transcriptional regulator
MSILTALPPRDSLAALPEPTLTTLVAALEEDIVMARLLPRERLVEDDLIERFGAKRHVVRDALARLEQMGLVERRRNIGAFVRAFSRREVIELYEMRGLLETEAARRLPLPLDALALQPLVDIQERHDAAVRTGDARTVFRANLDFHQQLFSMAGNEVLTQAIQEYARRTHAIRFSTLVSPDYRERARGEHWQMIHALRDGDRDTLVALCRRHLLPSRDAYLQAHPDTLG